MTSDALHACLADLAERFDEDQERANRRAWIEYAEGRVETDGRPFVPPPRRPVPPKIDWPDVHINDAIEEVDLMVLGQLRGVSDILASGSGAPLLVRCNYGTGILPSLFGCEAFVMDREAATLPTVRPLGGREAIHRAVGAGPPDVRAGLGGRVLDCADRFLELFRQYPPIEEHVRLYHPDLQGPIDVVELIWGSDMFLAFYDCPELLTGAIGLVTATYARLMRAWLEKVPPREEGIAWHWSFCHRGTLLLREDSLMNLSPELYTEFVRPADQELFDEFGGGGIHFCGRGDHFIEPLSEMRGLYVIDLSQPHLNDMARIFARTVDRGINLHIGGKASLDEAVRQGCRPNGRVAI